MDKVGGNQKVGSFFAGQYKKLVRLFQAKYRNIPQMEVEDVISELMTDLLDRTDWEGQVENLGGYIYRAVQNRIHDYLRRKKKTLSLDEPDLKTGRALNEKIVSYAEEAQQDSLEIRDRLIQALDELKPAQRTVWIATEMDGYTFRELSEMWGIPIGTLLARKHRANSSLQKLLRDLNRI